MTRSSEPDATGAVIAPPSGTLAFLFTDIQGSTVRWDRDPIAMTAAVRAHDSIMRGAIATSRGHVFKTIGDAFCAVFTTITDALDAAVAAQHALDAEDFSAVDGVRVRMALHVGTADERDGDYFGPTLNRVARLLAVGHGGQILLSETAAKLAREAHSHAIGLRDLGTHALKDLAVPEQIYQVEAPGLATEFPRLASAKRRMTNLHRPISSFIGRDWDVAAIGDLLTTARLVTLFGTGGLGKTRCSIEVGLAQVDAFADGVWFVDLAVLADAQLVPNAIAEVFEIRETPNAPILQTLTAALHGKDALIVLDNCEHVVDVASRTATAILRGSPKMKIVATSREALKIDGEIVYRMPALAVPAPDAAVTARAASEYGSVALFNDRARAANSTFALSDADAGAVSDICRRLDGIPLAIELAAARVKILTPRQLLQRLDERFRILTGGDRTALPRQQTMRALIDWSYDLLSEREREVFRSLAVFSGDFSLEMATLVAAAGDLDEFDALDALSSLVDKSFVLVETGSGESRYRLLESIRQYGDERLAATGDRAIVAARHAAAYADLSEALERDYEIEPYPIWRARAAAELDNIRAALAWSFGVTGDAEVGRRIAATLRRVLIEFSEVEARRWIATAIGTVSPLTPRELAAQLEIADATTASSMNQFRAAYAAATRALAIFEALGDARGIASAHRWAGRSLVYLGSLSEGEAMLRDSLRALEALGFTRTGGILRDLASARGLAGDVEGARSLFGQALVRFQASDDEHNVAVTAGTLAETEFRCGDIAAALRHSEEGIRAARSLGKSRVLPWLVCNLAAFLVASGDYAGALERANEALRLALDAKIKIDVAFALQHIAVAATLRPPIDDVRRDDVRMAARILGFVDARLAELDITREETEATLYVAGLAKLRDRLSEGELASLLADGAALDEARALDEASRL